MRKHQGYFITFEGIEGCGKSTQVMLLAGALRERGYDVLLTREPGGPIISEAIRKILLNPEYYEMLPETEMLLYMASRSQHTGQWILPALNDGKIVICDRYYDSTIAYQGAARDLDFSMIDTVTKFATYNTDPDLTFLIDLPVEVGRRRIKSRELDRLELETIEFHQKVREQYLFIATKYADRYYVIKGEDLVDSIHKNVLQRTLELIETKDL
ncbi:MAG: dTMP kinase [Candidatus Cloacimonetes bacterium]|nr:dTMP kinase [Candidatus Cloacimonadota bacterium]